MVVLTFVLGIVLGCASPQDRAYEEHEKVYKERLRLVDEYKKCVKQPATTSKRWRLVISISRRLKPLSDQVKDLFKWPTPCPGSLFSLALRFFGKVKTDIPSLC